MANIFLSKRKWFIRKKILAIPTHPYTIHILTETHQTDNKILGKLNNHIQGQIITNHGSRNSAGIIIKCTPKIDEISNMCLRSGTCAAGSS